VDPRFGPHTLNLDGDDDIVESVEYDISNYSSGGINILYQIGGIKDAPDPGDFLHIEILYPNDTWHWIYRVEGEGSSETGWHEGGASFPAEAFHERFKFRLRTSGNGLGSLIRIISMWTGCNSIAINGQRIW